MVEIPEFTIAGQTVTAGKNKLVKKVLGSLLVKSCVLLDPEGRSVHSYARNVLTAVSRRYTACECPNQRHSDGTLR